MNKNLNKSVYIPNLHACDIYDHMFKDKAIDLDKFRTGMLPYSIELIKLEQEGLKPKKDSNGKRVTNKIINVKFKMNVQSAKKQVPDLKESLEFHQDKLIKLQNTLVICSNKKKARMTKLINETGQTIEDIKDRIELMTEQMTNTHMQGMKREQLREYLYENNFVLNGIEYLPYKRSSAKSRKGEMIFITKQLHKKMMKWSRMGLDFSKQGEIDYPSLLGYESLVMSSILQDGTGLLEIKPENMLIVDDIESTFKKTVNIVRKENGFLETITDETDVISNIFDGESLLESRYFEDTPGKCTKLLRNHFFKSCSFSCNIQEFLRDNKPEDIDYDKWYLTDMFNNEIKAADVHFIFCPSSLKALKFSDVVSDKEKEIDKQADMYNYWKKIIQDQGSTFGVCKIDKISKLGHDDDNNILQQTSYQFLNSLPLSNDQLDDLLTYEKSHIERLKDDCDYFIDYVEKNENMTNANEMMVALYKRNPDIIHTEIFREFKAKTINAYVNYVKKGKIKLPNADYSTICSNPIELLKHAIRKFDINDVDHRKDIALKGNEIYCPMFEDGRELVCWRNPHTSQSNVLISLNRVNRDIKRYMNLSDNVVIINSIDHPIQPILSGSDQDGDTMAIVDNKTLLEAARECYEKYNVSINEVPASKNKYHVTYINASAIDNNLAKSTLWIGRVVNENQHILSLYFHRKAKGASDEELSLLVKQIDKFTILSEIAIDLSKKSVDIDIDAEIDRIKELVEYETDDRGKVQYPLFFKMVKKDKKQKKRKGKKRKVNTSYHETAMDKLFVKMSKLKYANKLKNKPFEDFLVPQNIGDANRGQRETIEDITTDKLNSISKINQSDHDEDEKNRMLENISIYFKKKIRNLTVSKETMHVLLLKVTEKNNGMKTTLLNLLYNHDKETFLNAFKNAKKGDGNSKYIA